MELDGSYRYELQFWLLVGPGQGSFASPGSVPAASVAPQPLGQIQRPLGLWEQQHGATQASLGTSPCTVSAAAPGDGAARGHLRGLRPWSSFPRTGSRAGLLPRDTSHGGMGDVGQAPQPLRFLPAQPCVQPTRALGRFTEQP